MLTIIGFLLIASSALQPQYAQAQVIEPLVMATTTQEAPEALVRRVQAEYGLDDSFYKTAACESHFSPNAVGDHQTSFGLWQIHLPAHPGITQGEAFDAIWSTYWAAEQFKKGRASMWTCYRLLD